MTLASIIETIALTLNCFCGAKDDPKAKVKDLLALYDCLTFCLK
jgi:hypothetical protein